MPLPRSLLFVLRFSSFVFPLSLSSSPLPAPHSPLLASPLSPLLASPHSPLPAPHSSPPRPNLLVILADDIGIGDTGFSGSKDVATPNIDRLAREGAVFTAGYVTAPVCSPSRAGYLSGRYQQRFGHEFNPPGGGRQGSPGLPTSVKLLPARLKEVGYRTAIVGKWHLGQTQEFHPLARGFDEQPLGFLGSQRNYLGESKGPAQTLQKDGKPAEAKGYLTDQFGDEGAAFITRQKGGKQPWFLWMAFNASHTPLEATEAYLARVPKSVSADRRTVVAMTLALDDNVGKLLKALEASGQAKDTVVVFTSDNGAAQSSRASNLGLRGWKTTTFEGGIRSAMAVRWPGKIPAGLSLAAPTTTLDLAATYLELASGKVPSDLDGRGLAAALTKGAPLDPERPIFWRMGDVWAVRKGDWKLLCSKDRGGPGGSPLTLLVNLKDDPAERTDLSAKNPAKRKELEAAYQVWTATLAAPLWKESEGRPPLNQSGAGRPR